MSAIIITGARGYIGSALAASLAEQGHMLRLVSRSVVSPNRDEAPTKIECIAVDLRNQENWLALLQKADAIIHLSSRTDLHAAEADPKEDRRLNVEPVQALVRAARDLQRPLPVVFASTVTIAGDAPQLPVNEQTLDRPCTVYDRHKLECEQLLRSAARDGLLHACSLRLANVYGYGSGVLSANSNRGILNEAMHRACRGEALTLYGKGTYIRDFIFIDDVVDAFCRALANSTLRGDHYVIASGRGYSLAEAFSFVVQEALDSMGQAVEIKHVPEPPDLHPIQRRNFIGDSNLFQKLTGWRPRVDLQTGIRDYFRQRIAESQVAGAPHAAA